MSEATRLPSSYMDEAELTAVLQHWRASYPDFVHLRSIGTSSEGRPLWLLTLGPEPERERPSVWVDGNMHASELAGAQVALAIAERIISLHATRAAGPVPEAASDAKEEAAFSAYGLPAHVIETLLETRFFVMPRMCPDGAEATLKSGRYVRSNPRDRRPSAGAARWVSGDVNGDGTALIMRQESSTGEFALSNKCPGLLLPRTLEDTGPFYKVYPEGFIENYAGKVPDPSFLSDNDTDLNRNFPYTWRPEPEQIGAGGFPTSEPESRAVVEFANNNPTIFAWLNLHTFGGVYIRPLGTAADPKMNPQDLAVFRQVGEFAETYGGYPMVSGFEDFLYEPDKPLYGDLSDFAYHQRGAIAYVCEIWDLFRMIGMERQKPFVNHYTHLSRKDLEALFDWDRRENQGRVFPPWKAFEHPQLGHVEVGGLDIRIGVSNPPPEKLREICDKQCDAFLRVAAMAPKLRMTVRKEALDDGTSGLFRVHVRVTNEGYLPTYVLSSGMALTHNVKLGLSVVAEGGLSLVDDQNGRREIGHLEGWGRGLHTASLFHLRSRGSVSESETTFLVRRSGETAEQDGRRGASSSLPTAAREQATEALRIRCGSPRTGWLESVLTWDDEYG